MHYKTIRRAKFLNEQLKAKIASYLDEMGFSRQLRKNEIIKIRKMYGNSISTSQAEDIMVRKLISAYRDDALERLWHVYSVGYFREDTDRFVSENFIETDDEMTKKLEEIICSLVNLGSH